MNRILTVFLLIATPIFAAEPWSAPSQQQVDAVYPMAEALYLDLHQHPELSNQEVQTASKIASHLRQLGYEVTEHFGGRAGTGVVGLLRNGPGPVVLMRTDMDALPVEENTGAAYASKVHVKDEKGTEIPVMHACGHDTHMAISIGTLRLLAENKDRWRGTVVFMGQPAEEGGGGAESMIAAGLLTKFPRPDFAIGIHDSPTQDRKSVV